MARTVLIVISSLAAEGTPRLALDVSRAWVRLGVRPVIAVIHAEPTDLSVDFDELRIERVSLNISQRGYWRYVMLAFGVYRATRKYRAAAVISMPLGWHSIIAVGARLAGARWLIAHVGNYPNPNTGRAFRKFRALVRLGRPLTDRLVCCSHYVRDGAIRHFGLRPQETRVIYNGVALQDIARRASVSRAARMDGELFTIGMVARLEGHKDQPTLIRAAQILKSRGRIFRVLVIGDGSRRQEITELIAHTGTRDVVTLLGMRRDIPELVGLLDLFAFSTTPDEGMGIALVEAMAAGVPIVASDVGACSEVLDGGRLGLLVTPGDAEALADAIEDVMRSPLTALSRARDARIRARRDFSLDAMAAAYGSLLGLHPSSGPLESSRQTELVR